MKFENELPYWLAFTHFLPRWGNEKINKLLVNILHTNKISLSDFYELDDSQIAGLFLLNEKEIETIRTAGKELPNLAFLVEDILSQGFEIITLNSPDYSKILKNNMKVSLSPPLLYIKGDKQMLQERSIAVVGSRDASEISFNFTDNVCLNATKEFRVVVSGFAKGVDQRALESTLKVKGRSIIVLPQGIMTFGTGIKKYYPQIVEGDVLVVSTFFPKAPWSVGLAMARNPVIYGLAENIFVAQSSNKGGTWEGVHDGLKRGRKIFVRVSQPGENIANNEFFTKGAIPVDVNGNITKMPEGVIPPSKQNLTLETPSLFGEE
jgi:DNA processing protein